MSNLKDIREKFVKIEIGGKERNLFYDLNAFAELEEIYGNLGKMQEALESISIKSILDFLWAGLLHEDPTLTKKQLGSMLSLLDLQELNDKIQEAIISCTPHREKNDSQNAETPDNPNSESQIQE